VTNREHKDICNNDITYCNLTLLVTKTLTEINLKLNIQDVLDVTLCRWVKSTRRFEGSYCFRL